MASELVLRTFLRRAPAGSAPVTVPDLHSFVAWELGGRRVCGAFSVGCVCGETYWLVNVVCYEADHPLYGFVWDDSRKPFKGGGGGAELIGTGGGRVERRTERETEKKRGGLGGSENGWGGGGMAKGS